MTLSLTDLIALATAILTLFSVIFLAMQVRADHKTSRGDFLLHFDDRLENYKAVASALVKHDWKPDKAVDNTDTNLLMIDSYMGLFERMEVLIQDGVLDRKLFVELYGYRIRYIVLNDYIRDNKLRSEHVEGWHNFVKMCHEIADFIQSDPIQRNRDYWKSYVAKEKLIPRFNKQGERINEQGERI